MPCLETMRRTTAAALAIAVLVGGVVAEGSAPDGKPKGRDDSLILDEWKVKREQVFEFTQKPQVTRNGDNVTITFESKGFCDVTVTVEDTDGRIIRHLASGVLGPNAPAPFKKNSKKQAIVWDGKDDQGVYVDDKSRCLARVCLGLKPRFERTLHWSPHRRIQGRFRPLVAPAPEGVYVLEGGGCDHIRLFSHEGDYIRTVYPFPPDRSRSGAISGPNALKTALSKVEGLKWQQSPQDDLWFPKLNGHQYSTLFTSGSSASGAGGSRYGSAASAFAVSPAGKPEARPLALIMNSLNRLAGDGTTGGLPLEGPGTAIEAKNWQNKRQKTIPRSAAFSPDGRWIYLTGYARDRHHWICDFLPAVLRMEYLGGKPPELFVGSMKWGDEGNDNQHLRCPTSVACDSKGRVYVADSMNHRIQVFTPDGKHYKTIKDVFKPVEVQVHPRTGEIYVASWMVPTPHDKNTNSYRIKPVLTRYGPVENPVKKASYPLAFTGHHEGVFMNRGRGLQHGVTFDFYTDPPTLWMVPGTATILSKDQLAYEAFREEGFRRERWAPALYRLYVEKDGKLVKRRGFDDDVTKAIRRVDPPGGAENNRQRMVVNPKTGKLYITESDGEWLGKAFGTMLEVNPATWKTRFIKLPFHMEEIAFGVDGHLYGRFMNLLIARYDIVSMREIPFDYGEEREKPELISCIPLPGKGLPPWYHQGGMAISPKGHIVVSCFNGAKQGVINIPGRGRTKVEDGIPYTPSLYPGRFRWGEVHVWDKHGKPIFKDAVPGLALTDGLAVDKEDNIYALAGMNRCVNGKPYHLKNAETLIKVRTKRAKVISSSDKAPVPLAREAWPKRPFDWTGHGISGSWIEGAEWMYGGVGYGGNVTGGCCCWNARFALDLLGRTFVTELGRFRVAVLDTNGNLILRIGKYGNVDDGVPLIKDGGPSSPRSVGGDEVALFHPSFVATHSDRRLFIADYGNYRILSVKLGYHAEEKVALKDMPEQKKDEGK